MSAHDEAATLTVPEAAKLLGISRGHLFATLKAGTRVEGIRVIRIGTSVRVVKKALLDFLAAPAGGLP
ncbi:MAG: excisionase family DNA-binding protein [Myxococcaceae bacterium]